MKIISKQPLWAGKFLRTMLIKYTDHYDSSSAVETRDWESVERVNCSGIVGIVPLTHNGEVILVRQFRPPVNGYVIELPAGLCDIGESPEDAAKRELIEETGYAAGSMRFLVKGPMSSGSSSEMLDVFVATDLTYVGIGRRDETENIEVIKVPDENLASALLQMQSDGNIIDLKINGLVEMARIVNKRKKAPKMKINDLKEQAKKNGGEYVFGAEDTGSHACYMIYGVLKPGEKQRMIKPGKGHEEIIVSVQGSLTVTGHYSGAIEEGHAFHIADDQTCFLENRGDSDAVYVIAGGHSGHGH